MMEEVVMKNGKMANDRLTNYIPATCMEAPEMDFTLIKIPYPFGAKGVGELPVDGAAPTLAVAICDAVELPFTPEMILYAVESQSVEY